MLLVSLIQRALKVRLYPKNFSDPTKSQEENQGLDQESIIRQNIGCCRAIYNMMLYDRIKQYDEFLEKKKLNPSLKFSPIYKTQKQCRDENEWLKEASSAALCQAVRNFNSAFSNFFKGLHGERKDKPGFPRFKSKKSRGSFNIQQHFYLSFEKGKNRGALKLPKIKHPIEFRDHRILTDIDKIKSVTVSMTPTGKFFASILYERDITIPAPAQQIPRTKGLDMSLGKFFVDDEGWSPEGFQRFYRLREDRLKFLQRIVSRRKKGSKNQKKAQHKVNILHEKISNMRNDFINKLSTSLSDDCDIVVVETLNLNEMSQRHNLGKSVLDLGFSRFVERLEYKLLERGKKLVRAPKYFLSSKTCSECGFINKELGISDRKWTCESCGIEHDRDQNAAKNLKNLVLNEKLGLEESEVTSGKMESIDTVVEPEKLVRSITSRARCSNNLMVGHAGFEPATNRL